MLVHLNWYKLERSRSAAQERSRLAIERGYRFRDGYYPVFYPTVASFGVLALLAKYGKSLGLARAVDSGAGTSSQTPVASPAGFGTEK